mgnify:FL=1
MTTYKYRGLSPDGAKVSGVIKAYNEYEAVAQLRQTCSVITKIEEVKETKSLNPDLGKKRIKDKELAIICSQFAIILTSGLPIVKCVEMVAAQAQNKDLRTMLYKVAEDVAGGYSLAQSFTNAGTAFPVTFVETIRAGEQSGTLELCFDRLHKYYDKTAKTKAKIISTLTYPAMVIVVAIVVFIIIMVVAVPMFVSTFRELGTDLPPITKGMIAVSDFLTGYWWVRALLALGFFIGRLLLKRDPKGRMWLAKNKLTRSPLKRLHTMSAASQFASTMATMLTAGLPLVKCLEVTANVIGNDMVAVATRKTRQGGEQGRGLAECMDESPYFPKMLTEMTGVGEHSGNLEETLTVIAEYFDNEVDVTTTRLLSLLEPCITIGLAILTVALLLGVYLPLFSMYGSM